MNSKQKDKIKIIGAIVFFLVILVVMILLFTKKEPDNEIKDIVLKDSEIQLAEFIITSKDETTLNLVHNSGIVLDTIEGSNVKLRYDTDLDDFMFTNGNKIYTASIKSETKENEDGIKTTVGSLEETEVYSSQKDIDDFAFNDNYIVVLTEIDSVSENSVEEVTTETDATETDATETDATEEKTSKDEKVAEEKKDNKTKTKDTNKEEDVSVLKQEINSITDITAYEINVIEKASNKNIYTTEDEVSDFVLYENTLVYARNNYLCSYNFETKEYTELYLGKDITTLDVVNDKLIVFSTFGNAKNKTTIMQLDVNSKIEVVTTHDTPLTFAVSSDEEIVITYIDCKNKPVFYNLDLTGERETKKKLNLNIDVTDNQYSYENTVYSKGYIYTCKDDSVKIIDLKANNVYGDYPVKCDEIYPVLPNDEEETVTSEN